MYHQKIATAEQVTAPVQKVQPEGSAMGVSAGVWGAMLLCYVLFFVSIFGALGSELSAAFSIVVSILYSLMYFGAASILLRLSPLPTSKQKEGGTLHTWTGPMSAGAVAGQILAVPIAVALFGVAISVIIAFVA